MSGQYAQIGQRPKHPGTLVDYKRRFRDDLAGFSEQEVREQWQTLMDEYEESREPSKDAKYSLKQPSSRAPLTCLETIDSSWRLCVVLRMSQMTRV